MSATENEKYTRGILTNRRLTSVHVQPDWGMSRHTIQDHSMVV